MATSRHVVEGAIQAVKAQAYDCLAQIEHFQRELQRLNQQLATLLQQRDALPPDEPGPDAR